VISANAHLSFALSNSLDYVVNEPHHYDALLCNPPEFSNLRYVHLWDLLAVRFAITPSGARNADSIPGFRRVLDSVVTAEGSRANLFERIDPPPYARVVPGAFKASDSSVVVPTLVAPRIDYSRVVLLTPHQPVNPTPIREMPPPSPARPTLTAWE